MEVLHLCCPGGVLLIRWIFVLDTGYLDSFSHLEQRLGIVESQGRWFGGVRWHVDATLEVGWGWELKATSRGSGQKLREAG